MRLKGDRKFALWMKLEWNHHQQALGQQTRTSTSHDVRHGEVPLGNIYFTKLLLPPLQWQLQRAPETHVACHSSVFCEALAFGVTEAHGMTVVEATWLYETHPGHEDLPFAEAGAVAHGKFAFCSQRGRVSGSHCPSLARSTSDQCASSS